MNSKGLFCAERRMKTANSFYNFLQFIPCIFLFISFLLADACAVRQFCAARTACRTNSFCLHSPGHTFMNKARNISLFATVILWATVIGGIMYSHLAFMPSYLHNLPASTSLVKGPHPVIDERFWMTFHPLLILSLAASLVLNWKLQQRRKLIAIAFGMYAAILVVTALFFVPELLAFAESAESNLPASEWLERGQRWEKLSWIRGALMYVGFGLVLTAFAKNDVREVALERSGKLKNVVETV